LGCGTGCFAAVFLVYFLLFIKSQQSPSTLEASQKLQNKSLAKPNNQTPRKKNNSTAIHRVRMDKFSREAIDNSIDRLKRKHIEKTEYISARIKTSIKDMMSIKARKSPPFSSEKEQQASTRLVKNHHEEQFLHDSQS
jgi:hypothetical protein